MTCAGKVPEGPYGLADFPLSAEVGRGTVLASVRRKFIIIIPRKTIISILSLVLRKAIIIISRKAIIIIILTWLLIN